MMMIDADELIGRIRASIDEKTRVHDELRAADWRSRRAGDISCRIDGLYEALSLVAELIEEKGDPGRI